MRDTLYAYLLDRPHGATPDELLPLIFTHPGPDPGFAARFLRTLLAEDRRFVWRAADGRWGVRLHDLLAQPLSACTYVVVDLETTGTGTGAGGIIEIGAARVRGGRVVEELSQLVNPEARLPPFVARLTGIDAAMLADQPSIDAVWPRVSAFIGDAVIVAHNARFDLGFLDTVAKRHHGAALANPSLCTLKLARRLLPALRRRGLDALAAHFGIPQADRHRALGDVRITVEIFFHLIERMAERGIVRLDQALDLQQHARDGRRFVCPLPRDTVDRLPSVPGVYRFFDVAGRLLYVGKAKNLRERVSSYLSNAAGHSHKTLDMIRQACDVRVEVSGSPLAAALDEAAAIRRERPPYNRLGKHLPRVAFVTLTLDDPWPRLALAGKLGRRTTTRYLGPLRDRAEAQRALGMLARVFRLRTCPDRLQPDPAVAPCAQGRTDGCLAPCAAATTAARYRAHVDACLAFFDGDTRTAERALIRRRDEHSAALRFEAAAATDHDLRLLAALERRQRTLAWVTRARSFIAFEPSADRTVALAYVVVGGRLVLRARVHDPEQIDALAVQVHALMAAPPTGRLRPDDIDGMTILAAWIRDRGEAEGYVVPLVRVEDEAGEGVAPRPAIPVEEWRAACASLLAITADGDRA